MKLITSKCPECGASIDIDSSRQFCFCQYCGHKIILDKENKKVEVTVVDAPRSVQTKILECMAVGDAYLKSGHVEEALKSFEDAVKLDETNSGNAQILLETAYKAIDNHYAADYGLYTKDTNANLDIRIVMQPALFRLLDARDYAKSVLVRLNKYDPKYDVTPAEEYIAKYRKKMKIIKASFYGAIAVAIGVFILCLFVV